MTEPRRSLVQMIATVLREAPRSEAGRIRGTSIEVVPPGQASTSSPTAIGAYYPGQKKIRLERGAGENENTIRHEFGHLLQDAYLTRAPDKNGIVKGASVGTQHEIIGNPAVRLSNLKLSEAFIRKRHSRNARAALQLRSPLSPARQEIAAARARLQYIQRNFGKRIGGNLISTPDLAEASDRLTVAVARPARGRLRPSHLSEIR